MRRLVLAVVVVISLFAIASGQQGPGSGATPRTAAESEGRLPVKHVVLYKNGVGYFEHSAKVRGAQELNIDFTTSQLNDVLNSLTVVDLGGGRITGVRFNSIAPLSERLKALRLPLGAETSRADFLNALRGTPVKVTDGNASAEGKVLSVETKRILNPKGDELTEVTVLSLVTASGELRSFDVGPTTSVRVADRDLNEEVGRYLNLIGSAKAQDVRRMTISAAGDGERDVFVSYISEVPIWKSTYRILLADKPDEKPLMQGWAIVDNTIGEDWKNVRLSLVAGAPQSFIQSISQPYYGHRPVVAMPESMTLTPQTHEAAEMGTGEGTGMAGPGPPPAKPMGVAGGVLGGVAAGVIGGLIGGITGLEGTVTDQSGAVIPNAKVTVTNAATGAAQTTRTDSSGHYRFGNLQSGNWSVQIESPGFRQFRSSNNFLQTGRMAVLNETLNVGAATQTIEVNGEPVEAETSSADLSRALEEQGTEARGQEIGEMFEYDIKQNVTIDKNQSALVPIVQARIDAEKVTLWNEEDETSLRALWMTNSSGETLDTGSFEVIEGSTFAGQGLLDAIRPEEKRLVSYAADPAVRIKAQTDSFQKPITRVVINKGLMVTTQEQREKKTYKISNSDTTPRQVVIEHATRPDWKLAGDVKPDETTASLYRFKVKVGAKQSSELAVEEYRPLFAQFALTNLTSDQVVYWTQQKRVTPAMEQAFRRVLDQKNVIARLDADLAARQQEIDAITSDQARLRENMKALKGSAEEKTLVQRYTSQLNAQEDRLATLRSQIDDLKQKREQAGEKLDQILNEITLTETF